MLDVNGRRLGLAIGKDTGITEHAAPTAALRIDAAGTVKHLDEGVLQHDRARRIAIGTAIWVAVASLVVA